MIIWCGVVFQGVQASERPDGREFPIKYYYMSDTFWPKKLSLSPVSLLERLRNSCLSGI